MDSTLLVRHTYAFLTANSRSVKISHFSIRGYDTARGVGWTLTIFHYVHER